MRETSWKITTVRLATALALIGASAAVPAANAAEAPPAATTTAPNSPPLVKGSTLKAPSSAAKPTTQPPKSGGTSAGSAGQAAKPRTPTPAAPASGATAAPNPAQGFSVPAIPSSTCAAQGVPPVLIPIYQRAAAAYRPRPPGARCTGRDQRDRDRRSGPTSVSQAPGPRAGCSSCPRPGRFTGSMPTAMG